VHRYAVILSGEIDIMLDDTSCISSRATCDQLALNQQTPALIKQFSSDLVATPGLIK
jgi:hypothetical protein